MKQIIIKYLEGRANEPEQHRLLEWLRNKDNRVRFRVVSSNWRKTLDDDDFPGGSESSWRSIEEQFLRRNYFLWRKTRKQQRVFKYAAVFFFLVSLGGTGWYFSRQTEKRVMPHTNVIAQGGQISRLDLPDGSRVWLNAGSTLSYDNAFSRRNRNIALTGEAYFDVAGNEALPFVVDCNGLQIKAVGTRFGAAAFPEDSTIDVVLEEGRVALDVPGSKNFACRLQPGEMARYSKNIRKLSVSRVQTQNYTAWRSGIISIFDQTLEKVARRLEKRYDQKIQVDSQVRDLRYTFTIKDETLDQVIRLMERITPVKAVQEDDVIRFEKSEPQARNE